MLSRAANSVYWMARYLERADNVARFLDVNTHLMLDLNLTKAETQWYPLIATQGDDAAFLARYKSQDETSVVKFLTFDAKNPNSILSCIAKARENARTVREIIPLDMWTMLNDLYHLTKAMLKKKHLADLTEFYDKIHQSGHVFTGLVQNSMSKNQASQFAQLGQMLERADKTARLIDVKYFLLLPDEGKDRSLYDSVQWGAVLKSAHALEMYRQDYHLIKVADVLDFLIFSETFPRSMHYCTKTALACLTELSAATDRVVLSAAALNETLKDHDPARIIDIGMHDYIDGFQICLNDLDTAIYQRFFSH